MTKKMQNDLFYLCSLIEHLGRKTLNKRGKIVDALGIDGIKKQLEDAEVNHCLSFEQVGDELIRDYNIKNGKFDTISDCPYIIPDYLDIGELYSMIIEDCAKEGKEAEEIKSVFDSFLSDAISDFANGIYFRNPEYLVCSYKDGYLLD